MDYLDHGLPSNEHDDNSHRGHLETAIIKALTRTAYRCSAQTGAFVIKTMKLAIDFLKLFRSIS